jgi:hypothetical protein
VKRLIPLALVVVSAVVAACSGSSSQEARTPVAGEAVVRGVSGLPPAGTAEEDEDLAKAADEVVDAIERQYPGQMAAIERDLKSGDPARIIPAKHRLDEVLGGVTAALLADDSTSLVHTRVVPLSSSSSSGGQQLVDAGQQLLCEQPKGPDGQPLHLGQVNGTYGDGRTGALGAARDTGDLVDGNGINVFSTLSRVDSGELVPDPNSRLGAYAATRGYPPGTVGNAVHNAIGTIFVSLANYGQENIGRVFNSPEARALYNQPVASCAGRQMALLEYQYWQDVRSEDPLSPGGNLGSAFNPGVRDLLQRHVF